MPAIKETSPGRLGELLGKIENTRSTFRDLLSNYVRKQPHFDATVGSGDLSGLDFKDEIDKIENSAEAETQQSPSGVAASRAIQEINDREIRTAKRPSRPENKDPPSPKSSPAVCGKRAVVEPDQDRLPSPKQKSTMRMVNLKKKEAPPLDIAPIRKSYLNFDLKNFKKNYNGTLVRIDPENV